ncbi:MAG: hypothetical protein A2161_20205, partial [Candidatus Schekmanbacteria bacterium RBG_13_48_7]
FDPKFERIRNQFRSVSPEQKSADQKSTKPIKKNHLSPIKIEQEIIHLSPTSFIQFQQCPAGYYFREILGIQDDDFVVSHRIYDKKPEDISGRIIGIVTHNLLEKLTPEYIPSPEDAYFYASQHMLESDATQKLANQAYLHMLSLLKSEFGKNMLSNKTHFTEVRFQLRHENVWIEGIIDRLFFDESTDTWTILDYKTNQISKTNIEEEILKDKYDIQLKFYALAVFQMLLKDLSILKTQLFFTTPAELWEKEFYRASLVEFEKEISSVGHQIQKGEFIAQPADSSSCNYCVFRKHGFCSANVSIYHSKIGYHYTVLK